MEKESKGPSIRRFRSICVFGGSNFGKNEEFKEAANELGKVLADRKINLVYGGGIQGLKGCVAMTAIVRGSKVLGVTLKDSADRYITGFTLGTELKVTSMYERMGYMLYNADAFIAVPGGLGTLEEISSIASWAKLNYHQKPLGLLNINGFYDNLLFFLDHAVKQELIPQEIRRTIVSASTADQLIDKLQTLAPEPYPLLKQMNWCTNDSSNRLNLNSTNDSSSDGELDTTLRL